jgi:hypothetical protein
MTTLAIFAVWFALQTPLPRPRQTINHATQNHTKNVQDGDDRANSAAPPVAAQQKSDPKAFQDRSQNKQSNDKEASVRVIEMPSKTASDWIIWVGNILLAATGIGAIIVAVCTLKKIERQTAATEDTAIVADSSLKLSRDTAKRQLRAYLSVVIGEAIYQEKRKAPLDALKFEARPLLLNTGQTPAHKISFKARAAIFPVPLPDEINLPETHDLIEGEGLLGPNQSANMFAVVDSYCEDCEVESIKDGSQGKGLYVWGLVTYKDAFGDSYHTRFCQHIYWTPGGQVRGIYVPRRNDAT